MEINNKVYNKQELLKLYENTFVNSNAVQSPINNNILDNQKLKLFFNENLNKNTSLQNFLKLDSKLFKGNLNSSLKRKNNQHSHHLNKQSNSSPNPNHSTPNTYNKKYNKDWNSNTDNQTNYHYSHHHYHNNFGGWASKFKKAPIIDNGGVNNHINNYNNGNNDLNNNHSPFKRNNKPSSIAGLTNSTQATGLNARNLVNNNQPSNVNNKVNDTVNDNVNNDDTNVNDSKAPNDNQNLSSILNTLDLDNDNKNDERNLPSSTPMSRVASSHGNQFPNTNNSDNKNVFFDWVYRDPSGNIQGPFNPDLMQDWFLQNYFPSDLLLRRVDKTEFLPLNELLALVSDKSKPFHSQISNLNLNNVNQNLIQSPTTINQSPVIRNQSPIVDLISPHLQNQSPLQNIINSNSPQLQHPQPQQRFDNLRTLDSRTSSPLNRNLWNNNVVLPSPSPLVNDNIQQPSREDILLALRHREMLEHQARVHHENLLQQSLSRNNPWSEPQLLAQQQQQQLQQQQLQQQHQQWQQYQQHQHQLQQQHQQQQQLQQIETQKQDDENTNENDTDIDASVQVNAPESTIASITEDNNSVGVLSPSPKSPVVASGEREHERTNTPPATTNKNNVNNNQLYNKGGVSVVTKAEIENNKLKQEKSEQESNQGKMNVSLSDIIKPNQQSPQHQQLESPSVEKPVTKIAPWAPENNGNVKDVKETKPVPSLRDIQEAEAKQSQARKQAQAAHRQAIQNSHSNARIDDIVPGTINWGLAGAGVGTNTQNQQQSQPQQPAWQTGVNSQKKSLRQIQEEEEAKEKEIQRRKLQQQQVMNANIQRGYAASAQRIQNNNSISQGQAGGAWTVVGQGGSSIKPSTNNVSAAVKVAPTNTTPAPKPAVVNPPTVKPASTRISNEPGAPSEEFIKWCKTALQGLNGTTSDEILPILLSFDIDKPDLELIQDMIYASSSVMDGRRFASEFARKRKEDQKIPGGFSGVGNYSASDVVKSQPKPAQETFKVVQKKKRR